MSCSICMSCSIWVSNNKLLPLFRAQKKCIRIMFGDKNAYLEKFKTCARERPHGNQELDATFYIKEHSKPLFKEQALMTVHNLHYYHCIMELFKILKFRLPIALHELFNLSNRKDTLLLTENPTKQFVYNAGVVWNLCRQKFNVTDFSHNIAPLKSALKNHIQSHQSTGDTDEWQDCNFLKN